MANPEHLEILKEGVVAWNEWRDRGPGDSSEMDADLSGADLQDTNLALADLRKVDLREANLRGATLKAAMMNKADLSRANLHYANLHVANLARAKLRGAYLLRSNLNGTVLRGADLTNARLGLSIFYHSDLKDAEGLESVQHEGPSNLDHNTIASSGSIPLSFLRGCGLPDLIIDNVEVLRGDPLQFYSCFISHSSEDADFAQRLHADLQDEGIRCWFAPEDMRGGRKTHHQINEAIRVHDKLVLVLSEASMDSNWVEHEIRQARQRERQEDRRVLFPIRLVPFDDVRDWTLFDADEGRDLAAEIREYHIPGFTEWKKHEAYKAEFERLVRDLRAED